MKTHTKKIKYESKTTILAPYCNKKGSLTSTFKELVWSGKSGISLLKSKNNVYEWKTVESPSLPQFSKFLKKKTK